MAKNEKFKTLLRDWLQRSDGRLRTTTDLVRAAKVPPASISMVVSGQRSLRSDVAERVAHVLCEGNSDRKKLQKQLQEAGQRPGTSDAQSQPRHRVSRPRSVVDRIRQGDPINVGFIVSEPFVRADIKAGFAVDLFRHLAKLMDLKAREDELQFKDLEDKLATGECDLVVSAVLPTFRRLAFMEFSRPFPYLGIPLSGLVSRKLEERLRASKITLYAGDLLSHPSDRWLSNLSGANLMYVQGEAGEEFTESFFDDRVRGKFNLIKSPADLAPANLFHEMIDTGADLFIADVGTCRAIMKQRDAPSRYSSLKESREGDVLGPILFGKEHYARLAVYRIAFGLPKSDQVWKETVDRAFDCLMSEGVRSLLSLYQEYLEPEHDDSFRPFLMPFDETVRSHLARSAFERLPAIRDVIKKQNQPHGNEKGARE
jgi:ABC-type amino acid transport substrate-binding protein